MPIVQIFLDQEQADGVKKALIEKVSQAIADVGCGPIDRVRVVIHEERGSGGNGRHGLILLTGEPAGNELPIVQMFLIEGRPIDVRQALAEKLSAALVEAGCGRPGAIRVNLHEIPSSAWGIGGKTARELGR